MREISIQIAKPDDIERLQKISRQTFFEAFSADNTEEDMKTYLEEAFSLEKLTAELNNKDSEFYFALSDSDVIGYLKLNSGEAQTDLKDNEGLEIERIYVLTDFHGKNVGQLLFEKAVQVAKQINANYVWLGVWEKNLKAISFYKKNGFVEFGKHTFKLGSDEQIDIMMKLQLK